MAITLGSRIEFMDLIWSGEWPGAGLGEDPDDVTTGGAGEELEMIGRWSELEREERREGGGRS